MKKQLKEMLVESQIVDILQVLQGENTQLKY